MTGPGITRRKMMRTAYLYTVLVIALILACLPLILKLYNVSDQAREWATRSSGCTACAAS